jgi:hypothetical protein
MKKFAVTTIAQLIANAVGLLLAALLLSGFSIGFLALLITTVIFSLAQAVLSPVVEKLSAKHAPQLRGGIALVTIFLGLFLTDLFIAEFTIGGISNWLAATLLIWLGSLVVLILLPIFVFPSLNQGTKPAPQSKPD